MLASDLEPREEALAPSLLTPAWYDDFPLQGLLDDLDAGSESARAGLESTSTPGQTTQEGEGEDEEGGEAQGRVARLKEKRREIARNYRERKKETVEKLRKRSRELESEQDQLRSRVIELQGEMDALRQNNVTDLSMENELLRVEIKRHKAFISQVLTDALHKAPSDTSPEEQYRLVRNGLESGKAKLLGMAIAAAKDPAWRESPTANIFEGAGDRWYYQWVPPNVTSRKEATRLKMRTTSRYPKRWDTFTHEAIKVCSLGERDSPYSPNCTVSTEDITPAAFARISEQIGANESIAIKRNREVSQALEDGKDPIVREVITAEVFGQATVVLNQVFPEFCEQYGIPPALMSPATVLCVSDFGDADQEMRTALGWGKAETARTDGHTLQGAILCANPMNEDETLVLNLNSVPLIEPIRSNQPHLPRWEVFDDDGVMHPSLVADLRVQDGRFQALVKASASPK